jgi:hypothetical protein
MFLFTVLSEKYWNIFQVTLGGFLILTNNKAFFLFLIDSGCGERGVQKKKRGKLYDLEETTLRIFHNVPFQLLKHSFSLNLYLFFFFQKKRLINI